MSKNNQNFWIDIGLFGLLVITILTATIEIFLPVFIHVFLGLMLSGAAIFHVTLHWAWIKNAFNRFSQLPDPVRTNFLLDLALFFAYSAAGTMGLIARSFIIMGPVRHVLGFFHVMLVFGVLILQTIHLIRHWKWVTVTARKAFH